MLRRPGGSRFVTVSLIIGGVLIVLLGVGYYRADVGYRNALATFGVRPSEQDAEMDAVVRSLLAQVPAGSSRGRVIALLDSLGFRPSEDLYDRQRAFYVDSAPKYHAVHAQHQYDELLFSASRFFCDAAAIQITFRFDDDWKLLGAEATTARGCV